MLGIRASSVRSLTMRSGFVIVVGLLAVGCTGSWPRWARQRHAGRLVCQGETLDLSFEPAVRRSRWGGS
jgi:hypothetical protein